jgi:two-component system alkaline phosphatase synthesis response regulator PhoP
MDQNGYKILIVDDEPDILEFLSYNLKKEGFQIYTSNNGKNALQLAVEIKPHLILLDIMMPEMDGIEMCEKIRETPGIQNCIVAFLTARTEDYSQIAGFEAGGDDYIAKPIKPKLLISRLNALLKRQLPNAAIKSPAQEPQISLGNIVIDNEKYNVLLDGHEVYLPKKEFELLKLLTSKPSKVFTRDEIFDFIWGNETFVGDRTLDVYIRKLREKLGENLIKTIKGVGYKFEVIK